MDGLLAQLFVALAASLTIGVVLGFTLGVHRRPKGDEERLAAPTDPTPPLEDTALADAVEREAALIEALAGANDDLHARARELAIANEEITCLLEQLHEARRGPAHTSKG